MPGGGFFGFGVGPDFGFDLGGGGGRAAAAEAAAGQRQASEAALQGMRESIAAQQQGFNQAQSALNPFMQRGLGYLDQYANMAMNPNLDSIRREREDATNNLTAKLAGMGMSHSGFAAKSYGNLESDYASRMYDARLRAMQPLLGVGPSAAGGIAGAAGELGRGIGGAYQQGYGVYGQSLAQQGQINAQGIMAPYQTWGSLLPVAGALGGAYLGARGR